MKVWRWDKSGVPWTEKVKDFTAKEEESQNSAQSSKPKFAEKLWIKWEAGILAPDATWH